MALTEQQELTVKKLVMEDYQVKGLNENQMLRSLLDIWFLPKVQQDAHLRTVLQTFRDREQRGLDEIDTRRETEMTNRANSIAMLDNLLVAVDRG